MREFIKNIIGNEPYEYQIKASELLLSGKNVILSVPTGAGKTWASIAPFLYAQKNHDNSFPEKMIYSSPLRTLTNSIYEDVSNSEFVKNSSIQTGEFNEDIYFDNEIIFSTIDQTLSNFLCFPLPLSQAQANINAGALIGSYLVFDEFHLLDAKRSMATTIGMLKMLGNLTRCCIMTATLESTFMEELKNSLDNYEIITLDDFPDDKEKIASLLPVKNKKKIEVSNNTISAATIAGLHKSKTIAICNRVESAQKIYQDLIELKKVGNPNLKEISTENIICLHSRFFDSDRKEKENKLKSLFGKTPLADSAILIATQVIEAGMDLSCDVMHTEISPINSFLQRAGRCARFANETGEIFIYNVLDAAEKVSLDIAIQEEDKNEIRRLNNKYLPYQKTDCNYALDELKKYQTLDGEIPKQLIEKIAKKTEENLIEKMRMIGGGGFNQGKIRESWESCEKNNYRDTIRDIQSVEITLIDDYMVSEVALFPYKYQSLGMYKWSLVGWLNKINNREGKIPVEEDDWLVMSLQPADDMFLENDESTKYELKKLNPDSYKNLPNQVYINSKYFGYDKGFGLNWQYEDSFNNSSPKRESNKDEKDFKPLTKDTFYQHNKGLLSAFEKDFLPKLDFTFAELAKYIEIPELSKDDFIRLIKLMIVLHDYGKLNDTWQNPMQKYQKLKDPNFQNGVLAHTDFNKNDERDIEFSKLAGLYKRPAHAGVGAFVAQDIIEELYDNEILKSSVSMAIARHHSSLSSSYPDFKITDKYYGEIKALLQELDIEINLEKEDFSGNLDGFETDGFHERMLYLFFVRILRLCDQRATENLTKYFNE
ncbi:MAG: CRISPR-associated helicase Cas3' [Chitinophagales bacterium]|nr:CRISPR-associated helicase Cas3' [Chitinophagales bacterium]